MNKITPRIMRGTSIEINAHGYVRKGLKMDKRNSKETMLEHIAYLTEKLEKVYEIGQEGIAYVGAANYAEREATARENLAAAYYDDIYSDT